MKEKDLKHRLQQTFDFSTWKAILPLFFKKIDYFSHPENLFTENDKVIEGQQIGTIKLDDGKQLAIFTIEVANNISIVRNRQGLREIAAKHIDQNIIHGALAFFYNKNQADYRFSFIAKEASLDWETGELKKDETKPKRFTYLLGANEACTTPAKRMLVLADKREKGEVNIRELKEVFSVEALNKDFFKTYKAHYEKFARYLADESNPFRNKLIDTEKETKDKEEKPIRDFVKKLLGRMVFLQFLGKKGWMGCDANSEEWTGGNPRFLYQLFEDFSKPEKFHSQCLTKLFFETLNTKRNNDVFEVKGLSGKLNGSRVPYLNGGLFEPEKNKATLEVDFPADYFKELLEFFDQYNFTIDENSPDDHEVGIDPEMLGHIFENLLEDNRDKGAFYTPKEIVQYMCKESLILYLKNFPPQKGWLKAGLVRCSKNFFDLPYNSALKQRAKELRQAGNLSEVLFWNQVKNKQFKGYDFDRQKIVGNYIVDFFCTNCNVVIEIDGSSHDEKEAYDKERDAYLESLGLTVIHIPVHQVMKNMSSVMDMLHNHPALSGTPPKEGNWGKDIEAFIRFHTVSPLLADKENAIMLNQKLDDIKVCDPAIGSGAFPIGMLQEIFEAKRFLYPYLKTNQEFNPAKVKKNIIQNSIYGVDIEKGAVDIAQLRFWLNLVVDEINPSPLPNLDYKIMQGNSLLEEFGGFKLDKIMDEEDSIIVTHKGQLTLGVDFDVPKIQLEIFDRVTKEQLWQLMEKFYDPIAWEKKTGEKVDKNQTKKDINDIVEGKIHAFVLGEQRKLRDEIAQKKKDWNIINDDYSKLKQKSKDYKKFLENSSKLETLNNLENQLINLQKSDERPYFLWHLYFMDVFEQGGFDVMIGNPPYIQLQKNGGSLAKLYENQSFDTFEKTGDIYSLFYEKGWQLLKPKGVLNYITSNKWMRAGYGESTRKFFAKHTNPILLIDFAGQKIFETATVDVNILMFTKDKNQQKTHACIVKENVLNNLSVFVRQQAVECNFSTKESWTILSPIEQSIKRKIEAAGTPLKNWDINIYRGILTGYNEAFIIDGVTKDKLIAEDSKSAEIIRPILRGRDIKRYGYDFANLWLINTHNGIKEKGIKPVNINDYPAIKKHLDKYWDKIEPRADQGETPYNLRNCAYMDDFSKQKIMYSEIVREPQFYLDSDGEFFPEATTFIMTGVNFN